MYCASRNLKPPLPHGIIVMSQNKFDDGFTIRDCLSTLWKRRPSSPNPVPALKNDLQYHLSFRSTPAACQRFSNVQKVPRLPRGWKSVCGPAKIWIETAWNGKTWQNHLLRKTTFQTPKGCESATSAPRNGLRSKKRARRTSKTKLFSIQNGR